MPNILEFEKEYYDLLSVVTPNNFAASYDNLDLGKDPFYDKYQTEEQRTRDREVTRLLKLYIDNYHNKVDKNKGYKSFSFLFIINIGCSIICGGIIYCNLFSFCRVR